MITGKPFYHEHIRKAIIAFGTVFNSIEINRRNDQGEVAQSMLVPLSYSTKQKAISRVLEVSNLEKGRSRVETTLPRIVFEMDTLTYDKGRKLVQTQTIKSLDTNNEAVQTTLTPAPFNLGINLSILTKNQDDGLQILEQILPYFTPDFNVTVNEIPSVGVKRDLCITLDSVTNNTDTDSTVNERVIFLWDLHFTIKLNFYGVAERATMIRKVIASIYAMDTGEGERYTVFATDGQTVGDIWAPIWGMNVWNDVWSGGEYALASGDTPMNYQFVEEFDQVSVDPDSIPHTS